MSFKQYWKVATAVCLGVLIAGYATAQTPAPRNGLWKNECDHDSFTGKTTCTISSGMIRSESSDPIRIYQFTIVKADDIGNIMVNVTVNRAYFEQTLLAKIGENEILDLQENRLMLDNSRRGMLFVVPETSVANSLISQMTSGTQVSFRFSTGIYGTETITIGLDGFKEAWEEHTSM